MAVFSLKQLLEAGGIFRISRTSDARPYSFDKVRMGTNLSVGFDARAESQGSATQEEKTSEGESQLRHFLGRLLMRCSMR